MDRKNKRDFKNKSVRDDELKKICEFFADFETKHMKSKHRKIIANSENTTTTRCPRTRNQTTMFSNRRFVTLWYHFRWSAVTLPAILYGFGRELNEHFSHFGVRLRFAYHCHTIPFLLCVVCVCVFFFVLQSGQWFSSIRSIYSFLLLDQYIDTPHVYKRAHSYTRTRIDVIVEPKAHEQGEKESKNGKKERL